LELSRLAQQQQGTPLSCRSSYDSLGVCSPAPSLGGLGLSRCGTPLSLQTASAADTPGAMTAATAAGASLGDLPHGVFAHGLPAGYASAAAAATRDANTPLQQQQQQLDACVADGSSGLHGALLSLDTWATTPMGTQQSPQYGSPSSRPSSPAVRALAPSAAAAAAAAAHAHAMRGSGTSSSVVTVAARQWQPCAAVQRCVSASGALTRSTSCGSCLAAAGGVVTPRASLPGVHFGTAAAAAAGIAGHVTRSMSGSISPAVLAAAAAAAAGGSSDGCREQQQPPQPPRVIRSAAGAGGLKAPEVPDWLHRHPAHLMWKQPHGKLRPLPGQRSHYHSDSQIQLVPWPAPAGSPAPAAAGAAAGGSAAAVAAAASDGGAGGLRVSSPALDGLALSGGSSLAPSMEASLLALQTKTIKCSMCGVSRYHGFHVCMCASIVWMYAGVEGT
jgi:hypothetical protein